MTTLAYRDGIIAADTGMTMGDMRTAQMTKIARNAKGDLAGICGQATYAAKFLRWFTEGETGPHPAIDLDSDGDGKSKGFIVRAADRSIWICEAKGMYQMRAPYYALGSGMCEANGALFVKAHPIDAVKAARHHNSNTWGEIESLSFDSKRLRRVR